MKENRCMVVALAILGTSCASRPVWFTGQAYTKRTGAYEKFLVATAQGVGDGQNAACEAGDQNARKKLTDLLIDTVEASPDIAATCGGPSRVESCLRDFASRTFLSAPRTRDHYDGPRRTCWVELTWLMPRHLAPAIRRSFERRATEEEVAFELKRAIRGNEQEDQSQPVQSQSHSSPTAEAAIERAYHGWFKRLLPVSECTSRLTAFVGAPRSNEARWLSLRKTEAGWIIVDDQRVVEEGWPNPPPAPLCD